MPSLVRLVYYRHSTDEEGAHPGVSSLASTQKRDGKSEGGRERERN